MCISYITQEHEENKTELHTFTRFKKEVVIMYRILLKAGNAKITKTFPVLGSLHPGGNHITGKHYTNCDNCKYS